MSRRKFTIVTTPELDQALAEIRVATGRDDMEVLRDALDFYDLVVQQVRQGKHVYIGESRESVGEVKLPHLQRARSSRFLDAVQVIIDGGKK